MSEPGFPYSSGRHADPVIGAPSLLTEDIVVGYTGALTPALRGVNWHGIGIVVFWPRVVARKLLFGIVLGRALKGLRLCNSPGTMSLPM